MTKKNKTFEAIFASFVLGNSATRPSNLPSLSVIQAQEDEGCAIASSGISREIGPVQMGDQGWALHNTFVGFHCRSTQPTKGFGVNILRSSRSPYERFYCSITEKFRSKASPFMEKKEKNSFQAILLLQLQFQWLSYKI